MEAEDKVGILAYAAKNRDHIIVSQDKDLKNIPGWHYNPVNEKLWYTTLQEANHHFWCQVLTGDRVDNILGIPGVGDKTALKILKKEPYEKNITLGTRIFTKENVDEGGEAL